MVARISKLLSLDGKDKIDIFIDIIKTLSNQHLYENQIPLEFNGNELRIEALNMSKDQTFDIKLENNFFDYLADIEEKIPVHSDKIYKSLKSVNRVGDRPKLSLNIESDRIIAKSPGSKIKLRKDSEYLGSPPVKPDFDFKVEDLAGEDLKNVYLAFYEDLSFDEHVNFIFKGDKIVFNVKESGNIIEEENIKRECNTQPALPRTNKTFIGKNKLKTIKDFLRLEPESLIIYIKENEGTPIQTELVFDLINIKLFLTSQER